MSDRETIAVYDARARDYQKVFKAEADASLRGFVDALPKGARVLDLGCGPGGAAGYMAAQGLRVEAWDASGEMVALAAQYSGVTARQAVFADLDAQAVYDGVWANFSLLHAPRTDISGVLSAIQGALKSGGVFHVAVKAGEGEARDGIGRLYTYFSETELTGLLRDAGFSVGPFRHGEDRGLDGTVAAWISTTAYA